MFENQTPATAAKEGEKTRACAVCGKTESERIPKTLPTDVTLGDVDGDGQITSADARTALRRSVNLETYPENSAAYLASDDDGDGTVTPADARMILRASVKLEDPSGWRHY